MSRGTQIYYTPEELSWIKENCSLSRREAHAAFCAKFGRTDVSLDNIKALCSRKGWKTGRTGCFPAGHAPANKGQKMPYNANSARTQFKKGHLPHNTKYSGHERVSKDGYVEISIDEENPHTGFERRYVLKHRYLWEKQNGPIPEGMRLKCLDGNRLNTDPSNWEALPMGVQPLMNGFRGPHYDSAEPEVKPVIMTMAKLRYTRSTKVKNKKEKARGET